MQLIAEENNYADSGFCITQPSQFLSVIHPEAILVVQHLYSVINKKNTLSFTIVHN